MQTTRSRRTAPPFALPSRMTFLPEGLKDMRIRMLYFPFLNDLNKILYTLNDALGRDQKKNRLPMRRLSNLLLASFPSLAHGFEWYSFEKSDEPGSLSSGFHALCVSTPNAPFEPPSTTDMLQAIQVCLQDWLDPLYDKGSSIGKLCDDLLDLLVAPTNWKWQDIDAQDLAEHIEHYGGLSYNALPALLATLMHGATSTLKNGRGSQEITWRRAQGDGSDRTGVFVVSCPFEALYETGEPGERKQKRGYFAYRLDFKVQTQVGRWNEDDELKPWVFLNVSCQRYAHETLVKKNTGHDVSVLVGTSQAPTHRFDASSTHPPLPLPTLVRLTLRSVNKDNAWKYEYDDGLARLMAAMNARPLCDPQTVAETPQDFGRFGGVLNVTGDEYYIVHTEGLKYGVRGKGSNHTVSTGFSFNERGEIVARVLDELEDVLAADTPLSADSKAAPSRTAPDAMRDFSFFAKRSRLVPKEKRLTLEASGELQSHLAKLRQKQRDIVHASVKRVLRETPLHLLIVARDPNFRAEMHQMVRDIWFLEGGEDWPDGIIIQDAHVEPNDAHLWDKLDVGGLKPKDEGFSKAMRIQELAKRRDWEEFLERELAEAQPQSHRCALIALEELKPEEMIFSIKGAVRAACASMNTASQMVIRKKPGEKPLSEVAQKKRAKEQKGRLQNAVLDLLIRQTGALYGVPMGTYKAAGLKESVARDLDVVAICRYQSNNSNVHYALAVRLSSDGQVDVLLPEEDRWFSYYKAGPILGQIFVDGRKSTGRGKLGPLYLSKGEMAKFAARVFSELRDRPTLVVIDADKWRDKELWPQLKNNLLGRRLDELDFEYAPGKPQYNRKDHLPDLIGVVRVRDDAETPQYIPRDQWDDATSMSDFSILSGFIDRGAADNLHYFSAARLPDTQKGRAGKQDHALTRDIYKHDFTSKPGFPQFVDYGSRIAFKHPQFIEMLPFFVRDDFAAETGRLSLCRVLHYLRISPGWSMGNILAPYPMHLGRKLIEDQCCIVGD